MTIKPFTVAQQLQRMSAWREAVANRPTSSSHSSEFLVDCWDAMEAASPNIQANKNYLLRDRTHNDMPPLAQFFDYVDNGLYPPPELLFTLLDAWRTYAESGGDVPLENAFFGKPVQKAGNYAARAMKKRKDTGAAFELGIHMSQKNSKETAAAMIAEKYGGSEASIGKIKPILPVADAEQPEK